MAKSRSKSRKSCVHHSGPKKGKLKKGFKFTKRGGCAKARKHRRK